MSVPDRSWNDAFTGLSTPLVADACMRLGVPLRCAPPGIHSVIPGKRVAGRVLSVRHSGIVIWGCHRDSSELVEIGFPVYSYGVCPAGPQRLDPWEPDALALGRFGTFSVGKADLVFADDDGVLFAPGTIAGELLSTARAIWRRERQQAAEIRAGVMLRAQLAFDKYLASRAADSSYTFRKHLRLLGGAIEE